MADPAKTVGAEAAIPQDFSGERNMLTYLILDAAARDGPGPCRDTAGRPISAASAVHAIATRNTRPDHAAGAVDK